MHLTCISYASQVMLGGLTAAHAPGERVLLLRGAGPAPFGARGLVLASQGGTCEVGCTSGSGHGVLYL